MAETKPPSPKSEALGRQLKESLAQRRPRPWKTVLATLFIAVLLLTFLAWWLYPRPRGAPLQLMALDVICTPDEIPHARALLFAPAEDSTSRPLDGHTLVFHEQPKLNLNADEKPREVVAKSDAKGQASVPWEIAPATLADFLVLHIEPAERRGSPRERGRIFVWPKDARLLLVDADETLIAKDLDAKAADALAKADKDGWHIVYVSIKPATAPEFRKSRDWLEKQARLPKGPVLGRSVFGGEVGVDDARRELLKNLQDRFNGPTVAIVKEADSANALKDRGIRTVVLAGERAWDGALDNLK